LVNIRQIYTVYKQLDLWSLHHYHARVESSAAVDGMREGACGSNRNSRAIT